MLCTGKKERNQNGKSKPIIPCHIAVNDPPRIGTALSPETAQGYHHTLRYYHRNAAHLRNSLPVNSWHDLTRIDRTETLSDEKGATEQAETHSETDDSDSADKDPKQWRGYPLHTSDSKFMFRITEDVESYLVDGKELSTELVREFRKHKVLVYKGATVSTKKEGAWWLIDDYYQTYSVRKSEYGLDVYSTAQWRFRPRWQFKITGLIQLLIFWGYAVIDGWIGRKQE